MQAHEANCVRGKWKGQVVYGVQPPCVERETAIPTDNQTMNAEPANTRFQNERSTAPARLSLSLSDYILPHSLVRMKAFSIADIFVGVVTAILAVGTIIPFSVVALATFVASMFVKTRFRIRNGNTRSALTHLATAVSVFVAIVMIAANYTPTKVVHQQLSRTVNLPSTTMTLAELSYRASYQRDSLPVRMSFCFADADKELVIEWPDKHLTLAEFLGAIESQTRLRRRFMHCGNGYTVLNGGDCCFGLSIRDPELAVPPFPRERFDVDAYAAVRPSNNNALNRSGERRGKRNQRQPPPPA